MLLGSAWFNFPREWLLRVALVRPDYADCIGAFFPIYPSVVAGIHNVDHKLVEVGEIYGLSNLRLIVRIFIPASLPNLFAAFAPACR